MTRAGSLQPSDQLHEMKFSPAQLKLLSAGQERLRGSNLNFLISSEQLQIRNQSNKKKIFKVKVIEEPYFYLANTNFTLIYDSKSSNHSYRKHFKIWLIKQPLTQASRCKCTGSCIWAVCRPPLHLHLHTITRTGEELSLTRSINQSALTLIHVEIRMQFLYSGS